MTDSSPRDSPTHVVVGRLSDHDYISIKSRESPAPRGIVINIENLGGGRSTPNQYTIHKGVHSSTLPNHLVSSNGLTHVSNGSSSTTADTLPVTSRHHGNGTIGMGAGLPESDNESEFNSLGVKMDLVWDTERNRTQCQELTQKSLKTLNSSLAILSPIHIFHSDSKVCMITR
jgi:hypothetical protein